MKGFDRNHGCWKIYGTPRNELNNFFLFFFLFEREREREAFGFDFTTGTEV